MERDALKKFFDLIAHSPYDAAATLDAFGKVVDSLSTEEVGDLIGMFQDKAVAPSKWEEALAPLADVVTAEERTTIVRTLLDRDVRDEVLKSLEQVHLFKIAQAREALERASR